MSLRFCFRFFLVYVFQIADPGRYLQCVRTLRDYAGKGCWEAQVRDWGQFTNFQLVSCDRFSLSICSFVLSLYSPAVIQKSSKWLFFWKPFSCHFLFFITRAYISPELELLVEMLSTKVKRAWQMLTFSLSFFSFFFRPTESQKYDSAKSQGL